MRVLLFWLAVFWISLAGVAQAKMETYDLITLDIPRDWSQEQAKNHLLLTKVNQSTGAWSRIGLYKAIDSGGSSQADFSRDWKLLVFDVLKPAHEQPQTQSNDSKGWKTTSASSSFPFNGTDAIVRLVNMTGYGKTVSFVAMANSQGSLAEVDKLLQGVNLAQPGSSTISSNSAVKANNANDQIAGIWLKKSGGATPVYGNTASWQNAGSSTQQYVFKNDGSYEFYAKTFRMNLPEMYLVIEKGSYAIDHNKLTLSPSSSTIESWGKKNNSDKWGNKLSSKGRKLEKTTYSFTKHYFSGIQEWNLVLQASSPTERDGPFGYNSTFQNAYYYTSPSSNAPPIELPSAGN